MTKKEYLFWRAKFINTVLNRTDVVKSAELCEALEHLFDKGYEIGRELKDFKGF